MDYAADSIQGTREYQQDDFGIVDGDDLLADGEPLKVFVVADGMGGHNSGEEASAAAVLGFVHHFAQTQGPVPDRLRATLDAANQALYQRIQAQAELRGMGTTLIAAAVTPTTLQWISVGDSKLRLFKAATGELRRVNADHSMAPVVEALEQEDLSAAGMDRNVLRSALLGEDIAMVDLSSQPMNLRDGDVLLLASDGLDVLSDDEIGSMLADARREGATRTVQRLLTAVEHKGQPDQDNTTAMVVIPHAGGAAMPSSAPGRSLPIPANALYAGAAVLAVLLIALLFFAGGESAPEPAPQPDIPEAEALEGVEPVVEPEPLETRTGGDDEPRAPADSPATMEPPAPAANDNEDAVADDGNAVETQDE